MLAGATAAALAAFVTLRWLGPVSKEWDRLQRARQAARTRQAEYTRLLELRSSLERRMSELRGRFPAYPPGRDVTADLLRALERTASEHGVTLLRRDAGREREEGDTRLQAITCQWEADLPALVRFLYALSGAEGLPDVTVLSIGPAPGGTGLRGTFTVEYAYVRDSNASAAPAVAHSEGSAP